MILLLLILASLVGFSEGKIVCEPCFKFDEQLNFCVPVEIGTDPNNDCKTSCGIKMVCDEKQYCSYYHEYPNCTCDWANGVCLDVKSPYTTTSYLPSKPYTGPPRIQINQNETLAVIETPVNVHPSSGDWDHSMGFFILNCFLLFGSVGALMLNVYVTYSHRNQIKKDMFYSSDYAINHY